jgi:hypothetical protein
MARHSTPEKLGAHGYEILKAATTIAGAFWCVQTLGRCVFTTMVDAANPAQAWASISLADGTFLYGYFTAATLSLGTAIFYNV